MDNVEQVVSLLRKHWGDKKLEALRLQAEAETTGIAFDALRVAGGQRLVVVICVTQQAQIELLRRAFALGDAGAPEDWTRLTLLALFVRAAVGPGFGFATQKDSAGKLTALALIAAEPRSMTMLELAFEMPK